MIERGGERLGGERGVEEREGEKGRKKIERVGEREGESEKIDVYHALFIGNPMTII